MNQPEDSSRESNEKARTVQTVQGLESPRKKQPAMAHNLLVQRVSAALLSVMFLTLSGQNAATAQNSPTLNKKYGIFIHYISNDPLDPKYDKRLPPHPGGLEKGKWETTVKSFSIDNFIENVKRTGAQYVIFTIGQTTDNFASPNKVLDQAAANGLGKPELASGPNEEGPGIVTSKTDLVGEIADRLQKENIDFYVYLPEDNKYDGKNGNGWIAPEAIKEYALRWKNKKIDGWWIDGCYASLVDRFQTPERAKAATDVLVGAAKTENPNALVFCNSEAATFRYWSENQGAIGGEEDFFHRLPDPENSFANLFPDLQKPLASGFPDSFTNLSPDPQKPLALNGKPVQWHVAPPLGSNYGFQDLDRFKKFYPEGYLPRYIKKVTDLGGAVTVDIGIAAEGKLNEEQLQEMDKVRKYVNPNSEDKRQFPNGETLPTNVNLALGKIAYLKRNEKPFATLQPERINIPGFPVFSWPFFGNNGKVDEYYSKPEGEVAWNYMVDLEQASQFNQVRVTFLNNASPSSYIIETSNDLETDGTIKWNLNEPTKAPTPGAANTYTFEIPSVTARYVRLKNPDAQTGEKQMAIKEFGVYNISTGPLTP
jgi:F5/8 type C domain